MTVTKDLLIARPSDDETSNTVVVASAEHKEQATLPIEAIIQAVGPFVDKWIDGQAEDTRREADIQEKELKEESSRNKIVLVGLFVLACIVLIIAGIVAYQGKGAEALRLIETVAALAAVAFGGYGWGRHQHRKRRSAR